MRLRHCIHLIIALTIPVFYAQADFFAGEFWYLSDIYPGTSPSIRAMSLEDYTVQALTEVRQEAVFVFSGMLYGFTYTYVPGSRARGIPEQLDLQPRASIKRVADLVLDRELVQEDIVRVRIRYALDNNEISYQRAWSSIVNHSGGMGSGTIEEGFAGKLIAIEQGIKESILAYLRKHLANRPYSASGSVLLREPPRVIIDKGQYYAMVETKVRIAEVREFDVF